MTKLKWAGSWRDLKSGKFRVLYSTSGHDWLLKCSGSIVSRHDSRDSAKRAAAKLNCGKANRKPVKRATPKAEECIHKFTRLRFKGGFERQGLSLHVEMYCSPFTLFSAKCDDLCKQQLPLGHSDETLVPIDVTAGGLIQFRETRSKELFMTHAEFAGFRANVFGAFWYGQPPWWAGWILREHITCMDSSLYTDAWHWDPTRPVAGQWEEHLDRATAADLERDDANTATLVADLDAKGPTYDSINDACDMSDDEDAEDGARACAACATTDGCEEHQLFTCGTCRKLTPWSDGGTDDEDGTGGDECSGCWAKRQPADDSPGDHVDQLCALVKEAGGTMRLYGNPVDADGIRAHVTPIVDTLSTITEQTRHDVAAAVVRHDAIDRVRTCTDAELAAPEMPDDVRSAIEIITNEVDEDERSADAEHEHAEHEHDGGIEVATSTAVDKPTRWDADNAASTLPDGHAICPGCEQQIDTDMCHCGSATDAHTLDDGHTPVPMGCICHTLPIKPEHAVRGWEPK